jgi:hypothetical protein
MIGIGASRFISVMATDLTDAYPELDPIAIEFEIADRDRLAAMVDDVTREYEGVDPKILTATDTLDELDETAKRLAVLLRDPVNRHRLVPALVDAEGVHPSVAGKRVYDLARWLDLVGRVARDAHRIRSRGQPKQEDLYDLVSALAEYWVGELDRRFTSKWHTDPKTGREPVSDAARFVADVVRLVDPTRVAELPQAMKNVVAERRRRVSSNTA